MVGRSYEETISLLLKLLKNAESQLRCEIMLALKKMVMGLGSAGSNCHKEIHKASKNLLSDRAASVKSAAAVVSLFVLCNPRDFVQVLFPMIYTTTIY